MPPSPTLRGPLHPLSVAPMMQVTDRHFRWFLRRLTKRTLLYTEMVTTGALLRSEPGYADALLDFDPEEHPIALQLGGDDPASLAACARMAEDRGYDEVDLNVGCPSSRVQSGCFGASLMARPEVVAECVAAMRAAVSIPVTVKHRIGIDELDRYEDMLRFVDVVSEAGADRFIVHARKAWLEGLSPKQNRTIPPLRHEEVHRLKAERPHLRVETNGGVRSLEEAAEHLERVDGVMIGRAAAEDPYLFATVDRDFYGSTEPVPTRREAAEAMLPYLARSRGPDFKAHRVVRHMHNLFAGQPGARAYRRVLSERGVEPGSGPEVLRAALARLRAA